MVIGRAGSGARLAGGAGREAATTAFGAILATGGGVAARLDRNRLTRQAALRALPPLVEQLFDSRYAEGLDTTIELRVLASLGGPQVDFAMRFKDGELVVTRGSAPDAKAWFGGRLSDMIRVASGNADWKDVLSSGRFELGGDPFVALRVPLLFGFAQPLRSEL